MDAIEERAGSLLKKILLTNTRSKQGQMVALNYISELASAERRAAFARAAEIVRGQVFKEYYRTWPGVETKMGDVCVTGTITIHCDALADALLAEAEKEGK